MTALPLSDGRHSVRLCAEDHQLARGCCSLLAGKNDRQHTAAVAAIVASTTIQLAHQAGHIVGVALFPVEHVKLWLKNKNKTKNKKLVFKIL
jgi:hypothetical protein